MNVNLHVEKTAEGATVQVLVDAPQGITGGDFVAQYDVDRWELPVSADLSSSLFPGGGYVQNLGNGEIRFGVVASNESPFSGTFATLNLRKKADAPDGSARFEIVKQDQNEYHQTGAEDKDNSPYTMEAFAAIFVQ